MNRFFFVLMSLFLIASTGGAAFAQPPVYKQKSYIKNGESDVFFIKKYGRPTHEFIKPRYEFVGEYSIGIENTYRSTNPEFRNIQIKEMFWNLNKDLNLTCFFHYKNGQWQAISYFFWPPGALF